MEKTNRCKTVSLLLLLSLIFQGAHALAQAVILIAQRPLKILLSAHSAFEQNLYPPAEIAGIVAVLVLHIGLFLFVWSQMEKASFRVAELLAIAVGGLLLVGSPISLSVLTNMGYAAQGAQVLANYSLLVNLMGMVRPLSRLGWVLLVVGATASLGRKRSCCPVQ
ncbi:MAG: hypothetical protein HFK04_06765 [Oscillospiraceae bacterium]|nr:hypothetical protein [Oscillospiraceae bacterium]